MTKDEYNEMAKAVASTLYENEPPNYEEIEEIVEKVNIQINEVLKGYIVQIGCQKLALTDVNDVSIVVSYYLNNKQECHRAYIDNTLTELVNKVLGH